MHVSINSFLDEIKMTSRMDSSCKILLLMLMPKSISLPNNVVINRGLQMAHPNTIAIVIKVHCNWDRLLHILKFPLGILRSKLKTIYKCSKKCLTRFFNVSQSQTLEYLGFKRSILEILIFSKPYVSTMMFGQQAFVCVWSIKE